ICRVYAFRSDAAPVTAVRTSARVYTWRSAGRSPPKATLEPTNTQAAIQAHLAAVRLRSIMVRSLERKDTGEANPGFAAHGSHESLPGVAGPVPGPEVCAAREPFDDDGVHASERPGRGRVPSPPELLSRIAVRGPRNCIPVQDLSVAGALFRGI